MEIRKADVLKRYFYTQKLKEERNLAQKQEEERMEERNTFVEDEKTKWEAEHAKKEEEKKEEEKKPDQGNSSIAPRTRTGQEANMNSIPSIGSMRSRKAA
eukprot:scpid60521/ scgid18332/ 